MISVLIDLNVIGNQLFPIDYLRIVIQNHRKLPVTSG